MNFGARMLPTSWDFILAQEGYYVWCGSMFHHRDTYYIAYSRWKKEYGFDGWVSHSEICLAKSDAILGTFTYVKTILPFGDPSDWDAHVAHNPTVITYDGMFYLYHMANHGDGTYWNHRNNQRIAVAYASDPEGEWKKADSPVIDVSTVGIDSLMTSNPTAAVTPDGKVLMVYKAVSDEGEKPKGGSVICAAAIADHPLGPFRKFDVPLFRNPEQSWSVEDPFIWWEDGKFHALVKDFHGYFSGGGKGSTALFCSENGREWALDENPLGYEKILDLGTEQIRVCNLERPQIYIEGGIPKVLLCACALKDDYTDTFNIRIPLKY